MNYTGTLPVAGSIYAVIAGVAIITIALVAYLYFSRKKHTKVR